jgi:DNA/RNA-binding domain of Phe-tRNA-synthetase-like protein
MYNRPKVMKIELDSTINEKYPDFRACFVLADNLPDYASSDERLAAEQAMVAMIYKAFPTIEQAKTHYLNTLYKAFYKSMGLRKGVYTPFDAVSRVLTSQSHHSIHRAIDISLSVEYSSLISLQAYDAGRITGRLRYTFATGNEKLETLRHETKTAKVGELILIDDERLVHSPYYGNNLHTSVSLTTTHFLFRIMGIPGLHQSAFEQAIHELVDHTHATSVVTLDEHIRHSVL